MSEPTVDQPAAEREPDNVTPAAECPNGADCNDHPRGHYRKALPERRTVSLEVLTDELFEQEAERRHAEAKESGCRPERLPTDAKVAVVLRTNGELVAIEDTDSNWRRFREMPTYVLARLLEQVGNCAVGGLEGVPEVKALMPTPDVLAALDGRPDATFSAEPPARSSSTIAAELRALASIFDAHPDFPVQAFGLSVGQSTDYIGGGDAVRRIGELLGLPVEERVREDGRRSWSVHRYGPLALGWSYIDGDAAVTE